MCRRDIGILGVYNRYDFLLRFIKIEPIRNHMQKNKEEGMDFHNAKMRYVADVDNNIRYYRSGHLKVMPEEKESMKQLIVFLTACKRLDLNAIQKEKDNLKAAISNMLYETLESGCLTREFTIVWSTTIHQANMFYNKCYVLCEFMKGILDEDEYKNEEKRSTDDMVIGIQMDAPLEVLVSP